MAKSKKIIKEKSIEITLWDAANKLRGSVESSEYKFEKYQVAQKTLEKEQNLKELEEGEQLRNF